MPAREKPVSSIPLTIPPPRKGRHTCALVFLAFFFTLVLPGPAAGNWKPLLDRLTTDGFNRQAAEELFARPEVCFEPDAMAGKIKTLLRSRTYSDGPNADRPRHGVRSSYLRPAVITRAWDFTFENRKMLEEIRRLYGVPKEIVVSILLIETHLGRNTGTRCVFNRLASMALCTDLEMVRPFLGDALLSQDDEEYARRRSREKADWAYNELKALLNLAERAGIDPLGIKGSHYGAIGLCQFMPSNVFIYGIDADRDGRIDPFARPDALHSIANYLRGFGWQAGMDREKQHRVIFSYNHSTVYANTVLAIADKLKARGQTKRGRP